MSNLVKWGSIDPKAEEAASAAMNSGGRYKFVANARRPNQQVGQMIRIFPPLPGQKLALHKSAVHYLQLPGSNKKTAINCAKIMAQQFCRVCELVRKWASSGNAVDAERAKEMEPALSRVGVLVDRDALELGPQKFALNGGSWTKFQSVLNMVGNRTDYCDPEHGYDILVVRTGAGFDTVWEMREQPRGPLGTPTQVAEWIASMPSFVNDLRVPTTDDVDRVLGLKPAAGAQQGRPSRTAQDATDVDYDDVPDPDPQNRAGEDDVPF